MENPVKNIIEIKFRGKISGEIFKYITIIISGVKSASGKKFISLKKAVDLKYLENEIILFWYLKVILKQSAAINYTIQFSFLFNTILKMLFFKKYYKKR